MMAFKQNKLKASVGTPFVVNTNEKHITRNAKRETRARSENLGTLVRLNRFNAIVKQQTKYF